MECHTIFLGQNWMGNSKKESKIQNSDVFNETVVESGRIRPNDPINNA